MKILILSITSMVAFFTSISSSGCSCIFGIPLLEHIKSTQFIFRATPVFADTIGTLVSFSDNDTINAAMIRFTFSIKTLYKGDIKSDTVQLVTGRGGGDCGFPFIIGKDYIIFSDLMTLAEGQKLDSESWNKTDFKWKWRLTTNICTATGLYHPPVETEILNAVRQKDGS